MSGETRRAINARTVESAVSSEDVIFGRINKHYGNGRVEVLIKDEHGAKKSVQAHIRRVLTKRGATPITTSDIVGLTPREFESCSEHDKTNYDLICVLDRKSVSSLEKEGKIPKWMIAIEGKGTGDGIDVDELFEFDYGTAAGGAGAGASIAEEHSDDLIDIDKI